MTLRREWTRVRWAEYEDGLEPRLRDLHERVHRGSYRAQASRRIYLKKPDGRQRPIGIAALEDKIVQQAVVTILNAPRRSPRMIHLCSDRVSHKKRRALIRKPQVGKALSSPPKAGHLGQVS